jgi:hypothetical protein
MKKYLWNEHSLDVGLDLEPGCLLKWHIVDEKVL